MDIEDIFVSLRIIFFHFTNQRQYQLIVFLSFLKARIKISRMRSDDTSV